MTTRNFYLNVEEDKILFQSIKFNKTTKTALESMESTMFESLSLSPSVIDVSLLTYMPMVGDIWNGEDFVGENGISEKQQPATEVESSSFSFVIDNVHSFYCAYPGTETSSLMVAALKSNPTISYEDVND
jgi:hypothetical protein